MQNSVVWSLSGHRWCVRGSALRKQGVRGDGTAETVSAAVLASCLLCMLSATAQVLQWCCVPGRCSFSAGWWVVLMNERLVVGGCGMLLVETAVIIEGATNGLILTGLNPSSGKGKLFFTSCCVLPQCTHSCSGAIAVSNAVNSRRLPTTASVEHRKIKNVSNAKACAVLALVNCICSTRWMFYTATTS